MSSDKTNNSDSSQEIQELIDALKFEDWQEPTKSAIERLIQIGQPAINSLIHTLESEDRTIFVNAAETLGKIGDEQAVEPLINIIRTYTATDCSKVFAAARGLTFLKNERAIIPILNAFVPCKMPGQGSLYWALHSIGEPAKLAILEAIKSKDENLKSGGFLALRWFIWYGGRKEDFDMLIAAIDDPAPYWLTEFISLLANLGDWRALAPLEKLQNYQPDLPTSEQEINSIRIAATEATKQIKLQNS